MKLLGRLFVLACVAMLIVGAWYGYKQMQSGFNARNQVSPEETYVARTIRDMAIPRAARELQNPYKGPVTTDLIAAGRAHWADHCATCHANDGSGNTDIGRNLYPKAPDMRLAATQNLTDGELYYIIRNGVPLTGMPAWGDPALGARDYESWHLVVFIRHLPNIVPEEIDEMKALNPKSEADRAEEKKEQDFLNGGDAPGSLAPPAAKKKTKKKTRR